GRVGRAARSRGDLARRHVVRAQVLRFEACSENVPVGVRRPVVDELARLSDEQRAAELSGAADAGGEDCVLGAATPELRPRRGDAEPAELLVHVQGAGGGRLLPVVGDEAMPALAFRELREPVAEMGRLAEAFDRRASEVARSVAL